MRGTSARLRKEFESAMPISPLYIALIVVTLAIGGFATFLVNSRLKKYKKVPSALGVPGAEMARRMLAFHGVSGVAVHQGAPGQDHFDPRTNSISLGPDEFNGTSITAIATACHEAGHAVQFAQGYSPMKVRSALVPVVNLASNAWMFLLMIGIFMNLAGFVDIAIIMYAAAVLFQIVTLPVEFNASSRAMAYLGSTGVSQGERSGASSVLRACAFTYVAAALTSILQLLYLLSLRDDN